MMINTKRAPVLHSAGSKEMAEIYLSAVRESGGDPDEFILRSAGRTQRTVLHHAVARNQLDLVEYLLADIDGLVTRQLVYMVDSRGNTALHFAKEGNVVQLLLGWEISKGDLSCKANKDGENALQVAVKSGYIQVITELLISLPKPTLNKLLLMADNDGNTVLHLCSYKSQMAQLLRAIDQKLAPKFISKANNQGNTALHVIHSFGCVEALLSSLPADKRDEFILMTNISGDTALHTARSALVARTLVTGVSAAARHHLISCKNGRGETALDTATKASRSAVEKYLLGIQEKSDHKQITVVSCGGLCVEQDDSVQEFSREG